MSTFRVAPFAPANETEAILVLERANLNGAMISEIAYGAHFVLFAFCLQAMIQLRRKDRTWANWMIVYISVQFFNGSVINTANVVFNQFMFIDNRDFPGGPLGYLAATDSVWYIVFAYAAWAVNIWLQDALLIYRLRIIYGGQRLVLLVPGAMFIANIVTSIMWVVIVSRTGSNRWQHLSVKIGLAWGVFTVGTTVVCTLLIVARLMLMRYRLKNHTGSSHGNPYLSVSAMLIESASLYSIWGGAFFIFYARQSGLQSYFLGTFGQMVSIAPLLILLRVASGRGWSRHTMSTTAAVSTNAEFNHFPSSRQTGATGSYVLDTIDQTKPSVVNLKKKKSVETGSYVDDFAAKSGGTGSAV